MNDKRRIYYIDFIESLAIVLVVNCHCLVIGKSVLANIIIQFSGVAVPLFFMCNGTLLLTSTSFCLKKHLQKTIMLFVSTSVWKGLYFIFMLVKDFSTFSKVSKTLLFQYFCGQNIDDPYVPSPHFWFMYALIGIYLLYPLLKIVFDYNKTIITYILILLLFYVFLYTEFNSAIKYLNSSYGFTLPLLDTLKRETFPFAQGAGYLLYFLGGAMLHERLYKKDKNIKLLYIIILIVSFMIMTLQRYIQQGTLYGDWVRLEGDYTRISTLIMSFSIYAICCNIDFSRCDKENRLFSFVSKRTMNIFSIHYMLCTMYIWYVLPAFSVQNILVHSIRTISVVVLSIMLTEPITFIPGVRDVLGIKPYKK